MLVKRPKSNQFRWMKYVLGFEVVVIGAFYLTWNQMNKSRDFRFFMHKNATFLLKVFYFTGESIDPSYNLAKEDKKYWFENGYLPLKRN